MPIIEALNRMCKLRIEGKRKKDLSKRRSRSTASSEQSAKAAEELSRQAESLQKMVSQFKIT